MEVTVLSFSSKHVFLKKLAISFFHAKFAFFSLAVKFSDVDLLNFWVVIYFSWPWSVIILFSVSLIFVLQSVLLTKLLTSGILFLRETLVAKLVILGILSSIFLILAL